MAQKMNGVILPVANGSFSLSSTIDVPKAGPEQVLVRSLVSGINPVEGYMQSGLMVTAWPIVLGCDASGTVVDVGEGVKKFKKGDGVFGCTRLGIPGYSTFQELFLMDEKLALKRPANVTVAQAATIGVGALTACFGVNVGTNVPLATKKIDGDAKWFIVLGAAGAVGQYAVQIAKLCGFKVLGSCSPANDALVKSLGADATFSYKVTLDEQIKDIGTITGGKFSKVFDASGAAAETGMAALATYTDPDEKQKYFSTTNDWSPIEPKDGIRIEAVTLGEIGREGTEHMAKVNKDIADFIPELEKFLESGALKPMEYELVEAPGFESVLKGLEMFKTRKADGKKLVVKIADE